MKTITRQQFKDLCQQAGITKGQTIFFRADIRRMPLPAVTNLRDELCPFFINILLELIGPEGSLFTNTANTDWASKGTPFHTESSPSSSGVLTEYLRTLPNAERSDHPGAAVSGIGPLAPKICRPPHKAAFSWNSPYGRLYQSGGLLVGLGLESFTFNHFIESLAGVPYRYHKIFPYPVFRNGRKLEGPFSMFVRYRHLPIKMQGEKLTRLLANQGRAKILPFGLGPLSVVPIKDYVEEGLAQLATDPHFLLASPLTYQPGPPPLETPIPTTP